MSEVTITTYDGDTVRTEAVVGTVAVYEGAFTPAAVSSVNGQAGDVVLDAAAVGALPDTYTPAWNDVTGKPTEFPAAAHTHAATDVTGLATVATSGAYTDLTGTPTIPTTAAEVGAETPAGAQAKADAAETAANAYTDTAVAGASGAVDSVNGQTGVVVLDAAAVGARPDTYTPTWGEVTAKPATFPPDTHTHDDRYYTETEVDTKLTGKADASALTAHTGNTSNPHGVTKAQVGLGSVPNVDATNRANHTGTQPSSSISDLTETVQDIVGAQIVAGANVTATYDDAVGTVTIAATGGGSSGSGSTSGALIGSTAYEPATLASPTANTTTAADLDATNLAVTFTAPASGTVHVRLTASATLAQGVGLVWGLRSGTTVVKETYAGGWVGHTGTQDNAVSRVLPVTGLTPGQSYTYKWSHRVDGTAGVTTFPKTLIGGVTGAAVMEVFDPTPGGSTAKIINAQTGTAYTVAATDAGTNKFLTLTNAAAVTLTVPTNATVAIPVGSVVEGAQMGAGQVTITAAGGVTVNATPGLKVAAQYGTFALLKTGTDTWLAMGRLSA